MYTLVLPSKYEPHLPSLGWVGWGKVLSKRRSHAFVITSSSVEHNNIASKISVEGS